MSDNDDYKLGDILKRLFVDDDEDMNNYQRSEEPLPCRRPTCYRITTTLAQRKRARATRNSTDNH